MDDEKTIDNTELIEEFLRYERSVDRSKWTIKALGYTLHDFFDVQEKPAVEIGCGELQKFFLSLKGRKGRGGKNVHPETIRKHINNLSSFYNYLEMEGYIQRSPIIRFRLKYMKPYNRGGSTVRKENDAEDLRQGQYCNVQSCLLMLEGLLD